MTYYGQEPDDAPVIVNLPSSEYTARKPHICDYCGHYIEPGRRYRVYKWTSDGEFQTQKVHLKGDECAPCDDEQNFPF